jgi:hypothetical protein
MVLSVLVVSVQVAVQCHGSKDEPKKYLSDVMCILVQACLLLATGPHPLQYTAMVAMNKVVDVTIVHRLTKERFVWRFQYTVCFMGTRVIKTRERRRNRIFVSFLCFLSLLVHFVEFHELYIKDLLLIPRKSYIWERDFW